MFSEHEKNHWSSVGLTVNQDNLVESVCCEISVLSECEAMRQSSAQFEQAMLVMLLRCRVFERLLEQTR